MIGLHCRQGLAHDKVREMRELILERYDKNFDGRLEINEVCVKTAFDNANHRGSTQSVCVADCYFTVNVLDLPYASPKRIYR